MSLKKDRLPDETVFFLALESKHGISFLILQSPAAVFADPAIQLIHTDCSTQGSHYLEASLHLSSGHPFSQPCMPCSNYRLFPFGFVHLFLIAGFAPMMEATLSHFRLSQAWQATASTPIKQKLRCVEWTYNSPFHLIRLSSSGYR